MDEQEPVAESEFVYRRIPRTYYQAGLALPVQPAAFRPNPNDTTGLSVFRARFLQPEDTLPSIQTGKRNDYFIARLAVSDLRRLGLTVVPEPNPGGPPGHATIPGLSWPAYQADKQRLKQVQYELAKLASAALVHQPA